MKLLIDEILPDALVEIVSARFLDVFPYYFHEPYFSDWVGSDPAALFIAHGPRSVDSEIAFLSRVMAFERD